jgi:hypothetical protein
LLRTVYFAFLLKLYHASLHINIDQAQLMKDNKDHATLELPGFGEPAFLLPETRKPVPAPRQRGKKQEQLDLLDVLGPTDRTGLPAWVHDDNTDLTGLPVWR